MVKLGVHTHSHTQTHTQFMGDFNVKGIRSEADRTRFYHSIQQDLKAFDFMLKNGLIEAKSDTIGAEQEICIVSKYGQPKPAALEILGKITDERFTNELALYNLEVNLSPQPLEGKSFSKVAEELRYCIALGKEKAARENAELFLTGILPSLNFRHLMFDFMTPEERYKILSEELLKLRGDKFEIFLQGVDDFHTELDSVLFEACNTSFQLHLQIDPAEFALMHNWSQMISGPVLSICTNSPLLFGKELWAENRIALFKQSLDTRNRRNHSRVKLPRVYFGNGWCQGSAVELWKKDAIRFPTLLQGFGDPDPFESLEAGIMPKLKSIRLHNGTTYTWNRLCYGIANNSAHIRIECRYLPSGPSMRDEIANFAFWIGLMKGLPDAMRNFTEEVDFRTAKENFMRAARNGIHSVFNWFGKNYSAKQLVLEVLLPMARRGLEKMGVDAGDIDHNLEIIEARTRKEQTGSEWQIRNFRQLTTKYKPALANRLLVQQSIFYQEQNRPVHEWENLDSKSVHQLPKHLEVKTHLVEDIMHREIFTVRENVSVDFVKAILEWKGFHHLPVEDGNGDLVGLIKRSMLVDVESPSELLARDVMMKNIVKIGPGQTIIDAKALMDSKDISYLSIVENGKLVGILTQSDL